VSRSVLRIVLVAAVLVLVTAACSREEKPPANNAFCAAAERYNDEIERTQLEGKPSVKRQRPIVEDLAASAPKQIRADLDVFLDALERRADGDQSVVDNPKIQQAVDSVNRYTNKACNVYERDTGL
jgi:hypothetical protein